MLVSLVSSILWPPASSARSNMAEINTSGYRCRLVRPPFHLLLSDICNVGDVVHHFWPACSPFVKQAWAVTSITFYHPFPSVLATDRRHQLALGIVWQRLMSYIW